MDFTAPAIQTQPAPANAGTKQLGSGPIKGLARSCSCDSRLLRGSRDESGPVWLTDAQFLKIAPHLPTDTRGKARVDDRRVISGIVHVLKSGSRWVDAPPDYGPKKTLYNRFVRWADKGDWTNLFRALAQAYALLSRRLAPSCSSSRPTVPTSIRSRTLSPSSRRSCEKPQSAPSKDSGLKSPNCCQPSRQANAQTTSPPPDTIQREWISL
jgi:transposase